MIFIEIIIAHKTYDHRQNLFSIMITMYARHIDLGKFSEDGLDQIIRKGSEIMGIAKRVDFLSTQFLGIDYAESTLIGDKDIPEVSVINLRGVDCLTFIEYVEAMRLSDSFPAFESNLIKVRYKSGIVEFANRNHFFTDWRKHNAEFVDDITEDIGGQNAVKVQKMLNEKEDGSHFLSGIKPMQREIAYIPSNAIDDLVIDKLRTGDYIGIYSNVGGLDVSHVGVVIRKEDSVYLRHASSQKDFRKVIDQDFKKYIADKPGMLVLRPK
jgi:hypothetical protein